MNVIEGHGTAEVTWLPFLHSLELPELSLAQPPKRVVVVAPHPDDEVLAVGGLLVRLARAGAVVEVVAVTDGEASHPGGSVAPPELARRRTAETLVALDRLGLPADVQRLGQPDGGRDALVKPVFEAVRLEPGEWLLGPWEGDGHPDHEAVGRACISAAIRDGARLLRYPVWAWHWATPENAHVPWNRARKVPLPADVRANKTAAIAAFVSQTRPLGPRPEDAPVLPQHVVDRFTRPYEVVIA